MQGPAIRRRWRIFLAARRDAASRLVEGRNRNPCFPVGRFQVHGSGTRRNTRRSGWSPAWGIRHRNFWKAEERGKETEKPRCFRGRGCGELVGPARPVYDSGMTLVEPARAERSCAKPKRGVAAARLAAAPCRAGPGRNSPRVFSHGRPENIARCRLRTTLFTSPVPVSGSLFRLDTKSKNDGLNR